MTEEDYLTCELCEKLSELPYGQSPYKSTVIGWICPDCYPTYYKINTTLNKYWNETLKEKLSHITI